ncbi:hypothetical protein [Streptomyces sp. NBC_00841]
MGGVVVHPAYQGRGIARTVISLLHRADPSCEGLFN